MRLLISRSFYGHLSTDGWKDTWRGYLGHRIRKCVAKSFALVQHDRIIVEYYNTIIIQYCFGVGKSRFNAFRWFFTDTHNRLTLRVIITLLFPSVYSCAQCPLAHFYAVVIIGKQNNKKIEKLCLLAPVLSLCEYNTLCTLIIIIRSKRVFTNFTIYLGRVRVDAEFGKKNKTFICIYYNYRNLNTIFATFFIGNIIENKKKNK